MSRRAAVFSASLVAGLIAVPGPASAAVTCSFAGSTASVVLDAGGDAATLSVQAGAVAVNGAPCDGATTANTDLIDASAPPGGPSDLTIDLTGGPLAPGATDEPGASDEIELDVDLGDGDDSLTVVGSVGPDLVTAGDGGINLNAGESDGVDADAILANVEHLVLSGGVGNDRLSAGGGAGSGGPVASPVALNGSTGADHLTGGAAADVFSGGTGFDTVDYSAATAGVTVTIGDGADDGVPGEGDDVGADVERVLGGPFDDTLFGDDSADSLLGGPGNDSLKGLVGDDELRGEDGNDSLEGGPRDDLLVGGPGDDEELGQGYNDVFQQNEQTIFESTAGMDIPDQGTLVATIDVLAAPTPIYDANARIDIEHPSTQHLTITMISPEGTRNQLSARRGNGTPFRGTVFDSEAIQNIRHATGRPFEGRFHPDGSMERFDSETAVGTWTLEIEDHVGGSTGTLNLWTIDLTFGNTTANGNDILNGGGGGRDLADYFGRLEPITATMISGADDGQAGEQDNVGADIGNVEDLYGGVAGDHITGTETKNEIRGQIGDDTIITLDGIDKIRGRQGEDVIDAGPGNDWINGGTEDDILDGGPGTDTVSHSGARDGPVTVDLGTGTTSSTGSEGSDSLSGIENVAGTRFDDVLIGDDGPNVLRGGGGEDHLQGAGGNDTLEGGVRDDILDGGPGNDWVKYRKAASGVVVDLTAGTATGGDGDDTITAVRSIIGSEHADTLTGTGSWNLIKAEGGDDDLFGLGGSDKLHGHGGFDLLDGGDGDDVCRTGEDLHNCES